MGKTREMVQWMLERARNITSREIAEVTRRLNTTLDNAEFGVIDPPPMERDEDRRSQLIPRRRPG